MTGQEPTGTGQDRRLSIQEQLSIVQHVHSYMFQLVQFADAKAAGVLVAGGALLAYVLQVLWLRWSAVASGEAKAGVAVAIAAAILIATAMMFSLACVFPRVWRHGEGEQPTNLLDFNTCQRPDYGELIHSATASQAVGDFVSQLQRLAAAAQRKH